ncbi:unnamed protein product [Linum trigynum]|uniref:Uncharacterized protein n=1 Tax=Linum trigynum TaxID=586398 RepID=A0AAV2E9A5_9ROSI
MLKHYMVSGDGPTATSESVSGNGESGRRVAGLRESRDGRRLGGGEFDGSGDGESATASDWAAGEWRRSDFRGSGVGEARLLATVEAVLRRLWDCGGDCLKWRWAC